MQVGVSIRCKPKPFLVPSFRHLGYGDGAYWEFWVSARYPLGHLESRFTSPRRAGHAM